MNLKDFYYHLPKHLIANRPAPDRDGSRLMVVNKDTGDYKHGKFTDILDLLQAGDCLVINNTKVIPARLKGNILRDGKIGGSVELLLHQRLDEKNWQVLCKPSRKCKPNTVLAFGNGDIKAEVLGDDKDGLKNVLMHYEGLWEDVLEKHGEVPLPHYIKPDGMSKEEEKARYNTVYAEHEGSVAAPTAGLHFTEEILSKLKDKNVDIAHITLHVGLGTFKPVKSENITEHNMHSEYYQVEEEQAKKINLAKASGGRIIAVGTTSCRTLESIVNSVGQIEAKTGHTDIYIYPGFKFRAVDGLLTNFHLPESTLIMLVSAFCKMEYVLAAYAAAIAEEYRFYSFGDATLLL